ncbi:MAG: alpha/beta hydrolase [Muribaculaceae bacterium]|nr:alpha/beta hydrolase [Muribaculaceae bacterium]
MKHFFFSILLALISVASFAQSQYSTLRDVPYSSKSDEYSTQRLKLDIHYNTGAKDIPVIVWFHGGGLTGGNKFIPAELKENGYVVVAPNYRLIPDVDVEECIDDAAEAVAWTFKNIERYGGDPKRIFVSGHSAGGYLTSMIGLEKKWLDKYGVDADSIAALIPYSGQVITHFSDRKSKGIGELTPYVDNHAPLFHVRNDCPSYIIITGDAEQELYGRYEENLYMWRMMKLAGHPDVRIYKLDGYNHGDMASPAHHIMKQEISRILSEK